MNRVAEAYVKLVLALGRHDPDYVDAYYGPRAWREEAAKEIQPLGEIRDAAVALARRVAASMGAHDEGHRLRQKYLAAMIEAVAVRAEMLGGMKLSFDRESEALYGAVAPRHTDEYFGAIREELSKELPGQGSLLERYEAFKAAFTIPAERLDRVFSTAIDEARRRTQQHLELPPGEGFRVEYVTGKSWGGYNWYQGNYSSLIQVNTDLPIYIDRAIDLAAHEGYPGHHVYHSLCEKHLVRDRGWVELTVYPLFSPQGLIAEGSANFGVEVAFPDTERVEFEREVLFPVAGLDPAAAGPYERVRKLADRLAYAGNEAARRYLDGELDAKSAADWLGEHALMPRARAEQRVRFFDQYRAYVINDTIGKDLVRQYVEARGGTTDNPQKRWHELARLLSSPRLPGDLKTTA
jgi:hypothetical protein